MTGLYEQYRPKSWEDFGALRLLNDETRDHCQPSWRRLIVLLCDQPEVDMFVLDEVTGLCEVVGYARADWQAGTCLKDGDGLQAHQEYLMSGETHLRWQLHLALEPHGWLEMEASLVWLQDLLQRRMAHKRLRDTAVEDPALQSY
jgi:hypothetical protein